MVASNMTIATMENFVSKRGPTDIILSFNFIHVLTKTNDNDKMINNKNYKINNMIKWWYHLSFNFVHVLKKPKACISQSSAILTKPKACTTHSSAILTKPKVFITHSSAIPTKPKAYITYSSAIQTNPKASITHSSAILKPK